MWIALLPASPATAAATLPSGFTETLVATGLQTPTNMQFAPDGRLFVTEQGGTVRIIENGVLLSQPFLSVTVSTTGERGLLGITFDPDFANNKYVYVYYTSTTPTVHNRLSRFTANGNIVLANSEHILIDFPTVQGTIHYGGSLRFGPDGKLYMTTGDDLDPNGPETPNSHRGKVFRLNSDGSAPSDNPFYSQNTGYNKGVWAMGFRNPFTFAIQPTTGRIFVNDVGQDSWEEINDVVRSGNYGWNDYEGYSNAPGFVSPVYAYSHSATGTDGGCAITGGAFYNPPTAFFPSQYIGKYFYVDYCRSYINVYDPSADSISPFATNTTDGVVALEVSSGGALYYLARGSISNTAIPGSVLRIDYLPNSVPTISQNPSNQTVSVGQSVTFTCSASGAPTITYQWQRSNTNIPGATGPSYTLESPSLADNNATFRCVATNPFGSTESANATLTVNNDLPPVATILTPVEGISYSLGSVVSFTGTGTDAEDGNLSPGALTWWVDMYHDPPNLDTHSHPVMPLTSGISSGNFTIPLQPHGEGNFWYRIHLRVTDSNNNTHEVYRDVMLIVTSPPNAAPIRNIYPTSMPTLTWGRVSWAANYRVEVSMTTNFTGTLVFSETVTSDVRSLTVDPLEDGTYYWRVCALSATTTRCSIPDRFVIDVPDNEP
jgi:glucose/arabinose dehydrogenase